jgi:hypothetical protein
MRTPRGRLALDKFDGDGVDTVPLVRDGESLALKHVPQVSVALPAHDLDSPHAPRVVHLRLGKSARRSEHAGPLLARCILRHVFVCARAVCTVRAVRG